MSMSSTPSPAPPADAAPSAPAARAPAVHNAASLLAAAKAGDVAGVEAALRAGVPVDARDASTRYTPLMHACDKGKVDVVRMLLAAGADVNAREQFGACARRAGGRCGRGGGRGRQ